MNNRQDVINLIKAVSGQANVLTIPRALVEYTEGLDRGLLLSQIIYWSDKTNDPDGWFYKTYAEWQQEICLSEYEVRRNAKWLVEKDILQIKVKKAPNGNPTVHYRLDWDKFSESFLDFLQKRNQKDSSNGTQVSEGTLNTEITAESTASKGTTATPRIVVAKVSNPKKPQVDHPAIAAYRHSMDCYPAKNHWLDIIATVGEDKADLAFWEQVVKGWKLTGWNPRNTGGMLDYFRRREIPTTKPSQLKGVKLNGRASTGTGELRITETTKTGSQVSGSTINSTNRDWLKAHLERKRKSG